MVNCGVEDAHQFAPVRPSPVDLPTAGALVKLGEGPAGSFSESRLDRRLRNFDDPGIASEAARERSQRERTESGKHLHELLVRHRFADEVPVHDDPALEEASIPRQQDSLLAAGDLGELVIPGVTAVYRIAPA
jgi:hypothetical protein